jgi:nucleotide-binding universal stress UspA family protein
VSYRSVLVGSDGSATAELAVRGAAEVAAEHGARLVVVTAYTPGRGSADERETVPEDIRWAVADVNQAEQRIRHGRQVASDAGVEHVATHAAPGSAADVILDAADAFAADLIVLGSKGLTPGTRSVLGSVAAAVAHHAPCDGLIDHTTD